MPLVFQIRRDRRIARGVLDILCLPQPVTSTATSSLGRSLPTKRGNCCSRYSLRSFLPSSARIQTVN
jgi:hypothetical protein